jgi:hypothetical protein
MKNVPSDGEGFLGRGQAHRQLPPKTVGAWRPRLSKSYTSMSELTGDSGLGFQVAVLDVGRLLPTALEPFAPCRANHAASVQSRRRGGAGCQMLPKGAIHT